MVRVIFADAMVVCVGSISLMAYVLHSILRGTHRGSQPTRLEDGAEREGWGVNTAFVAGWTPLSHLLGAEREREVEGVRERLVCGRLRVTGATRSLAGTDGLGDVNTKRTNG